MQEGSKALAAPAVRRVAREYGLDLASIAGTGPDGRITKGGGAPGCSCMPTHCSTLCSTLHPGMRVDQQSCSLRPALCLHDSCIALQHACNRQPNTCQSWLLSSGDVMAVVQALAAGSLPPPQDTAPTADAAMAASAAEPDAPGQPSGPSGPPLEEGSTVVPLRHVTGFTTRL